MIIHIQLKSLPGITCPFCGGPVKIKDYSHHSYNHLDIAGTPSRIDWKRRRYVCKDCGRSFSEGNPFGPEGFRQSYEVLKSVAVDLRNIHYSFWNIAQKHHIIHRTCSVVCGQFSACSQAASFKEPRN